MSIFQTHYSRDIFEAVVKPFLLQYNISALLDEDGETVLIQADISDGLFEQLAQEIEAYNRRP